MKMAKVKLPVKLDKDEKRLITLIGAGACAAAALAAVFAIFRLLWQLACVLKEARKTMPVVREAAEIYIDERIECYDDEDIEPDIVLSDLDQEDISF